MSNELTEHFGIPKPDPAALISDDVTKLQEAMDVIDAALKVITDAVAAKAASSHSHEIAAITGLADALAAKMAATKTFTLAELTDVEGAEDALTNYILTKLDDVFVFRSALSVLGEHGHAIEAITGLADALAGKAAASHDHAIAGITGLVDALAAKLAANGGTAENLTVKNLKETPINLGTGTAFAPDLANGSVFRAQTSGHAAITLPTAVAGQGFALWLTYGGAHVPTFTGEDLKAAEGAMPEPTSLNGRTDIYAFSCEVAGIWTVFDGGRNVQVVT